MRLAVLSDIHGNLLALEAVLKDLETQGGADLTWCLGDIAAFGSRPVECIQRIKELAEADEGKTFKVIGGNTDRYLVNGERPRMPSAKDEEGLRALASVCRNMNEALLWCVDKLSFPEYEFLKKIRDHELSQQVEKYGYVIGYHAVPGNDETVLTLETPDEEAGDLLLDREGSLAIGGHIHRQFDRQVGNWRILNAGSIGEPLDVRGQAGWALLTFENGNVNVELRRVPFDIDAVIADYHAAGYPSTEWSVQRLLSAGA